MAKNEIAQQERGSKELTGYDLFNPDKKEATISELPAIEIVHPNAFFELPNGNTIKEIRGILLRHHKRNAWWENKLGEGEMTAGAVPDCFAVEINIGEPMRPAPGCNMPQAESCYKCDNNKFGSHGEGKACKNKIELFLLVPGFFVPLRLSVPPTSLKSVQKYLDSFEITHLAYQQVTTVLTLEKKEKGQQKYSVMRFEATEPEEDYEKLKMRKAVLDQYYELMVKVPEVRDELAEYGSHS